MKMLALSVSAFLTASLPSLSAMGDPSPLVSGPRPGTVDIMRCLVRQGPKGCEKMFVGQAWLTAKPLVFGSVEADFQRGPFVSSSYWGQASDANFFDHRAMKFNASKDTAILDVKFAHKECTFY